MGGGEDGTNLQCIFLIYLLGWLFMRRKTRRSGGEAEKSMQLREKKKRQERKQRLRSGAEGIGTLKIGECSNKFVDC